MRLHPIVRWGLVLIGLGMVAAAILAPQLGLDSNQDWGPSRRLLLAAGILTFALAWLDRARSASAQAVTWLLHTKVVTRASDVPRHFLQSLDSTPSARRIRGNFAAKRRAWAALLARSPFLAATLGNRRTRVLLAAWGAFLVVSASYAWYASVGMWVAWPGTSAYYDMQAEAFLHGQAHLLEEPDPRLLTLPNPYDPEARAGIPYIWDASLFEGHYYLYWGPAPALLITPLKATGALEVGDNVLVFLFMTGAMFWSTWILTRMWWDYFRRVPGWIVAVAVLCLGWANPSPWLLNNPYIYESAIAGGQFFLLMGTAGLFAYLGSHGRRTLSLLWAGVSFSLAAATRASLAPGILCVSVLFVYWIARNHDNRGRRLRLLQTAAYFVPLFMTALALGTYNGTRFGSPLETGMSYMLGSYDTRELGLFSMSTSNVPPNLYNHLVNPVRSLSVFPYFKANWGGIGSSILRIPVPETYFTWQISGLLIVAPFVLFLVPATRTALRRPDRGRVAHSSGSPDIPRWVPGVPLVIGLVVFSIVQLFVTASMRYQGDFILSLLLASAFGLWSAIIERARSDRAYIGTATLGLLLMIWTSVAGLLLGVTSVEARFEILNPELFDCLTRFFTP